MASSGNINREIQLIIDVIDYKMFNPISTGLFCLVVALGGGGGCFPPPFYDSFVFKVRLLKFCTELLSDRMNNLR